MTSSLRVSLIMLLVATYCSIALADGASNGSSGVRVLSWNISDDAPARDQKTFVGILRRANPDILLLDEVAPTVDIERLQRILGELPSAPGDAWHIDVGASGGRQRGVIISRAPIERLSEFASVVPYPETGKRHILDAMSETERNYGAYSMEFGIPVNAVITQSNGHRLLLVITDLQCCGNSPESWQEYRRRIEAREIRKLVRQIIERQAVDGIVLAGDFNAVNTPIPLLRLMGPYPLPHASLIPAELYHLDGVSSWTWDGRGTPFPSSSLDYQMYSPASLDVRDGYVLDTEDLPAAELREYGLESGTSKRQSEHRPLVVEYMWKSLPYKTAKDTLQ
jgi:endonuclease/exonuclease/phosphatase family metal-dependent hydrolase